MRPLLLTLVLSLLPVTALADDLADCLKTCEDVAKMCTESCAKKAKGGAAACKTPCGQVGDGCKKDCKESAAPPAPAKDPEGAK